MDTGDRRLGSGAVGVAWAGLQQLQWENWRRFRDSTRPAQPRTRYLGNLYGLWWHWGEGKNPGPYVGGSQAPEYSRRGRRCDGVFSDRGSIRQRVFSGSKALRGRRP